MPYKEDYLYSYCLFDVLQDREDFSVRHRLMKEILAEHGQRLVANLIHACVFCLHSYMVNDVADVLVEVMDTDREVQFCVVISN